MQLEMSTFNLSPNLWKTVFARPANGSQEIQQVHNVIFYTAGRLCHKTQFHMLAHLRVT